MIENKAKELSIQLTKILLKVHQILLWMMMILYNKKLTRNLFKWRHLIKDLRHKHLLIHLNIQ